MPPSNPNCRRALSAERPEADATATSSNPASRSPPIKVPVANEPAPISPSRARGPFAVDGPAPSALRLRGDALGGAVLRYERTTPTTRLAGLEELEGPLGVPEREPVGDELRGDDFPVGDQAQEGVHVALLGPADMADRVVEPVKLVVGVVPAGPV